MPTFSFLAVRFLIAAVCLACSIPAVDGDKPPDPGAGILIGLFLFAGYAFQTFGLSYTTASKAGFITGLSW
jgi:drug/metabolite transporter (DMT)-like permease